MASLRLLVKKVLTFQIRIFNLLPFINLQCCRFYPSCSSYALEAIEKKGICKGIILTLRRLLHCHPFSSGGYDPVP
jgi:putative membrane protein insertion efficiency factor